MKLSYYLIILSVLTLFSCQGRLENREGSIIRKMNKVGNTTRKDETERNRKPRTTIKRKSTSNKNLSSLFKELEPSVFMVFAAINDTQYSQGSGFFIGSDIGVTNAHVLEGRKDYAIKLGNNIYPIIEILDSSDSDHLDYVIFRIDKKLNRALKIAEFSSEVGEDVFTIGSPKGLTNSFTKGTISGFRNNDRIQIDATIDHGSSGGPLFNLDGEVIGITTSGLDTGAEINFAVDIQAIPYRKYN